MKKVLFLSMALLIAAHAWGQSSKKKPKKEENTEQTTEDEGGDKDKKTSKKDKSSKDDKKEADKKAPVKKTPTTTKPTTTKPGSKNQPPATTVMNYYYELPATALPQITDYIARRKQEAPLVKTVDNQDLRKGFVLNQDLERGYLNLALPNETKYTHLQLYKVGATQLMAVEVTNCSPKCENSLNFYRRDTGQWREKTSEYMPALDYKWVKKRLQEKYKEQYMDLDLYNSLGYDNDETLKRALMYIISPDENKIFVREGNLPIDLYEMTWDAEKSKFVLKKLTD